MKGEPVEKFYGCLRELSLNCDLGSREESIKRDAFTANMQDGEIQRELLKETREPKKALEIAISIEMGIQTQLNVCNCRRRWSPTNHWTRPFPKIRFPSNSIKTSGKH